MKHFNEKCRTTNASHTKNLVMNGKRAGQNVELENTHITIDIVQNFLISIYPLNQCSIHRITKY